MSGLPLSGLTWTDRHVMDTYLRHLAVRIKGLLEDDRTYLTTAERDELEAALTNVNFQIAMIDMRVTWPDRPWSDAASVE